MNREKKKLEKGFYKEYINDETLTKANAILVIKCANLEQTIKKQKEVIDKAVEFLSKIKFDKTDKYIAISEYSEYQQLLDILKEVSE